MTIDELVRTLSWEDKNGSAEVVVNIEDANGNEIECQLNYVEDEYDNYKDDGKGNWVPSGKSWKIILGGTTDIPLHFE